MNFKKYMILAAVGLGFAACSDEDKSIFDQSAAERLEASRSDYKEALTADGGLWAIEYFTNNDEPGYVMLMQFGTNGAVEVSADHQWIGNKFRQETSLWDIVSDNGTVLTFNSYNTIFHIFSTPENIEGTGAPKNEDGEDINELGYGHEGDYEFLLMEKTPEMIRMSGKKHHYEARLIKLPADTDPKAYLDEIRAKRTLFSEKFTEFLLTEPEGQTYCISGLGKGIAQVYPYDFGEFEADPVEQTVKANGILTAKGFRFRNPLTVKRADGSTWELSELFWQEDGSLATTDGTRVTGPDAAAGLQTTRFSWSVDLNSFTGSLAEAFEKTNEALKAFEGKNSYIKSITFKYGSLSGKMTPMATIVVGKYKCDDYYSYDFTTPGELSIGFVRATADSEYYDNKVPEYKAFKQMLCQTFGIASISALDPSTVVFTAADGATMHWTLN